MAERPLWQTTGIAAVLNLGRVCLVPAKCLQHLGSGMDVIPCLLQIADAECIRLILLTARVALREILCGLPRQPGEPFRTGQPCCEHPQTAPQRASFLALRMASDDVADLVAEHRCQFRLAVHDREQSTRHVDVAAGYRERIDNVAVDEGERTGVLQPRCSSNTGTDRSYVGGLVMLVGSAEFGKQPWMLLSPIGAFCLGDARRRIVLRCAAGRQQQRGR